MSSRHLRGLFDVGPCNAVAISQAARNLLGSALVVLVVLASTGVVAATASPAKTVLLSGDAVGAVHFGAAEDSAAAALQRTLGPTKQGVEPARGNCTIDAALYWKNFAAFFFKGKFVGYQTGNNESTAPEPAFNGATAKGLRPGDTLATARRLYPGAVTTSGENGGVYEVRTPSGALRGYLSEEVRSPASTNRIVTISAGSVGCPADSPG